MALVEVRMEIGDEETFPWNSSSNEAKANQTSEGST